MNLISWAVRPYLLRQSNAHLVTKPRYETQTSVMKQVTKPVLTVTKPDFFVTKPLSGVTKLRYETQKSVTKPVTKPLIFRPTLSEALRNRYETLQNAQPCCERVEGIA